MASSFSPNAQVGKKRPTLDSKGDKRHKSSPACDFSLHKNQRMVDAGSKATDTHPTN